jgi:hypothetical protein
MRGLVALLATAAIHENASAAEGKFNSFAHVVVDAGGPTVSIIPLGQVLAHDFIQIEPLPTNYAASATASPPTSLSEKGAGN